MNPDSSNQDGDEDGEDDQDAIDEEIKQDFEYDLFHPDLNMLIDLINKDFRKINMPNSFIAGNAKSVPKLYLPFMFLQNKANTWIPRQLKMFKKHVTAIAKNLNSNTDNTRDLLTFIFNISQNKDNQYKLRGMNKLFSKLKIQPDFLKTLFIFDSDRQNKVHRDDKNDSIALSDPKENLMYNDLLKMLGLSKHTIQIMKCITSAYNMQKQGWMQLLLNLI